MSNYTISTLTSKHFCSPCGLFNYQSIIGIKLNITNQSN